MNCLNIAARVSNEQNELVFASQPLVLAGRDWRCVVRADAHHGTVVEYEFRLRSGHGDWEHQSKWLPNCLPERLYAPNQQAIEAAIAGERRPTRVSATAAQRRSDKPTPGAIGFYRPDSGNGLNPNLVLAVGATKATIYAAPLDLVVEVDIADWMSLEETRVQTRGLATSDRYGPGGEMHEMLPRMLAERVDSLAMAVDLQARSVALMEEYAPQATAQAAEADARMCDGAWAQ